MLTFSLLRIHCKKPCFATSEHISGLNSVMFSMIPKIKKTLYLLSVVSHIEIYWYMYYFFKASLYRKKFKPSVLCTASLSSGTCSSSRARLCRSKAGHSASARALINSSAPSSLSFKISTSVNSYKNKTIIAITLFQFI